MTDSGRIREATQPEGAVYPFPGQPDEAAEAEEEDLLMPGSASAWGDAAVAARPAAPEPPAAGVPAAGTPAAGTPAAGTPAGSAHPAPGTPVAAAAVPVAGTPPAGTPLAPAPVTPIPPATTAPAAGAPVASGGLAVPPAAPAVPVTPVPLAPVAGMPGSSGADTAPPATATPAAGTPLPPGDTAASPAAPPSGTPVDAGAAATPEPAPGGEPAAPAATPPAPAPAAGALSPAQEPTGTGPAAVAAPASPAAVPAAAPATEASAPAVVPGPALTAAEEVPATALGSPVAAAAPAAAAPASGTPAPGPAGAAPVPEAETPAVPAPDEPVGTPAHDPVPVAPQAPAGPPDPAGPTVPPQGRQNRPRPRRAVPPQQSGPIALPAPPQPQPMGLPPQPGAWHSPAPQLPDNPGQPPAQVAPGAPPAAPAATETAPAAVAPEAPAAPAPLPEPQEPAPPAPAPGSAASAYPEAEREAVHRLMRERRDVREGFRPDAVPDDVLLRVLEAAHTAPSVGLAQPWDFVVIRSPGTRQAVHDLALRQREEYVKTLPRARARQFKELRVDAILDAPVNIVVTADPTRGGRPPLGQPVQPLSAPYSSALAVENLWLAARAEGLGVGWVGFFDERALVRALEIPGHLEIVAYLCVGYVDEFPEQPEAAQAGWSPRRPLSWVVHEEAYGRRALPGAVPHDLLSETLADIRPLDAQALGEAWERQKRMTKPVGALGALEVLAAQLCGLARTCPPPVPEPAAVAVFAGDHGVHAQGVTPWPQEVTAQMVANFLSGGAVCNAFANQVGAEVCVVDVGVRGDLGNAPGLMPRKVRAGTADFTTGPAMTREEALRAVEVGIETARDLVAAGNRALLTGEMGIANTTVSAALVAVFTDAEPAEVTGRGTGIDEETLARKTDVVRRALHRHQPDPADPLGVLAAVGGLEHAALTGFILGGASLRVPVILDGVTAGAAALVARAIAPEAVSVCVAGHRSSEPGHLAALTSLGLRPLVDLDLRLGEGTGAVLALPVVQSAARALREVATFDAAGVADKN